MNPWPSTRARRVLAALLRMGWSVKRQSGSHRTLSRPDWPDFVFAFHDDEEIGPKMLPRIAKHTGITPDDFWIGFDAIVQLVEAGLGVAVLPATVAERLARLFEVIVLELQDELAEVQERLEFAERMLAQVKEPPGLPAAPPHQQMP